MRFPFFHLLPAHRAVRFFLKRVAEMGATRRATGSFPCEIFFFRDRAATAAGTDIFCLGSIHITHHTNSYR